MFLGIRRYPQVSGRDPEVSAGIRQGSGGIRRDSQGFGFFSLKRDFIENLLRFYRKFIENLSRFYRKFIEILSRCYRKYLRFYRDLSRIYCGCEPYKRVYNPRVAALWLTCTAECCVHCKYSLIWAATECDFRHNWCHLRFIEMLSKKNAILSINY